MSGATQYLFRFENSELAASVVRTTSGYILNLKWMPAMKNGDHEVQVRTFQSGARCVTK